MIFPAWCRRSSVTLDPEFARSLARGSGGLRGGAVEETGAGRWVAVCSGGALGLLVVERGARFGSNLRGVVGD
jgi:hypothetical protein